MKRPVTIVFGPPGTGKTTRLLEIMSEYLRQGMEPEQIAFVSFSRKAAREARDRAMEQFGYEKERLPWFRTLHSVAYKLLKLSKSNVMQTKHYKEMGEIIGYGFDVIVNDFTDRLPTLDWRRDGDRCLHIYSLYKAKLTSVEEEWRNLNYQDLTLERAQSFGKAFESYKIANALVDFTDMLDHTELRLPVEVLIIDEAQDLSAQQWRFARAIGSSAIAIYLAGDDDQAIYGFNGATSIPLLSLAGQREFLPHSYRLPISIHGLATSITNQIRARVSKSFTPRQDKGVVKHVSDVNQIDLSSGTWLLLSRCRYGIDTWAEMARSQNVVFSRDGTWSNRHPTIRAVVAWEAFRKATPDNPAKLSPWDRHYLSTYLRKNATFDQDWMSALDLPSSETEYIRGLRRRNEPLSKAGRVTISTIHEAKGGEAQNVALITDTNSRVNSNFATLAGADEERRVLYVGVTRAINNLYLVRPTRRFFYSV